VKNITAAPDHALVATNILVDFSAEGLLRFISDCFVRAILLEPILNFVGIVAKVEGIGAVGLLVAVTRNAFDSFADLKEAEEEGKRCCEDKFGVHSAG